MHDAHPAPAAAGGGFDNDGIADLFGDLHPFLDVFHAAFAALKHGNAVAGGDLFGDDLVAHVFDELGGGAYEFDAGVGAFLGEIGVLGQVSVSGMHGLHFVLNG